MLDIGCTPLRYLIGGDDAFVDPLDGGIVEYSYDMGAPCRLKYGTLTSEKERFHGLAEANSKGRYAPYLPPTDITGDYGEWVPDPKGSGFEKNVAEQVIRAVEQKVQILELDNPDFDGLAIGWVLRMMDFAQGYGLAMVAKNPLNTTSPRQYLNHPAVALAIVEAGDYGATDMARLRLAIGKPQLPVRFVTFGKQRGWAQAQAAAIVSSGYTNMGVTWSPHGEYTGYEDLIKPWPTPQLTRTEGQA